MAILDVLRHHAFASLIAALGLGLGARIVMRIISWVSALPGSFSAGGSFEVVLFGALIAFPAALAFFWGRQRIRVRLPWPGLLLGAALFLVLALLPPGAARSAMEGTPDPPIVTGLLFLSLFLLFGVGLEWRWASWCRRAAALHGRGLSAAPVQGEGACAGPEYPTKTS